MNADSRAELWNRLVAAHIVTGAVPPRGDEESIQVPWYVRALTGIAGWIAAGFLLAFIGVALGFVDSNTSQIITGLVLIAGAYGLLLRTAKYAFASQFAIAMSLAGQALVWMGIEPDLRNSYEWLIIAAFQAGLAVVLPNFVLRVWCAGAAALALAMFLFAAGVYFLSIGVIAAATALVWQSEFAWPRVNVRIRAIGYGLTLALVVLQATVFFISSADAWMAHKLDEVLGWAPPWLGWLLPGVVLVAVVWQLHARNGSAINEKSAVVAVLAAALVTAASFKAPGIATGLMLVLLGYSNANRSLAGLGLIALLSYLSAYYYLLETSLLMKSLTLAVTGAVLIGVRFIALNLLFPARDVSRA
jgi:Domain of unknown function (DUF4401)